MTDNQQILEAERKAFRSDPNYNFADFQEIVSLTGGDRFSPAQNWHPQSPGDNMAYFGFRPWIECATFSVLSDEWKMPTFAGVYAVTTVYHGAFNDCGTTVGYLHLCYIGSSKCIAERVNNPQHYYRRMVQREPKHVHTELWVMPTTDYRRIERDLIKRLRPLFNIHHRNG